MRSDDVGDEGNHREEPSPIHRISDNSREGKSEIRARACRGDGDDVGFKLPNSRITRTQYNKKKQVRQNKPA